LQVAAFALFHLFDVLLRLASTDQVLRWAGYIARPGRLGRNWSEVQAVGQLRSIATLIRRYDYRSRLDCLPRALMMFVLLRRLGHGATFSIGVRTAPFAAHAWVTLEGRVVSDYKGESQLYDALYSIPKSANHSRSP